MSRRGTAWLILIACVVGASTTSRVDGEVAGPPGQVWIVASPAACDGADGALTRYEATIRAQATEAAQRASRTPRVLSTRAQVIAALAALAAESARGWLFIFLSGHGSIADDRSRVCVGDGNGRGEWLDVDRDLVRALPASLSGAVIVLDACVSASVDPHLAAVPTVIISASPYVVETRALFGTMILASLAAARDDNCNGVFDDDDLFTGMTNRMRAYPSLVALEASPKLRRNAQSAVPLPVRAVVSDRCARLIASVRAFGDGALPMRLVEQRRVQEALARGGRVLPGLDRDFFVLADDGDRDAAILRRQATAAGLEELHGLGDPLAALAATTTFAEIYKLERIGEWLWTWRLRDRLLVSVAPMASARCGLPARVVTSRAQWMNAEVVASGGPRYTSAVRYLRTVNTRDSGHPVACFEPEGQCFIVASMPVSREAGEAGEAGEECGP